MEITYQSLSDATNVVLRGKFTALNIYIKKISNKQPNAITQGTKKRKKTNPKAKYKKERINDRAEVNQTD